jgi:hypothetical protein
MMFQQQKKKKKMIRTLMDRLSEDKEILKREKLIYTHMSLKIHLFLPPTFAHFAFLLDSHIAKALFSVSKQSAK